MDLVERLTTWHANGGWGPMDGWRHMDNWGPMGGGWAWLWGLLMLIGIVALIVLVVVALTRGISSQGPSRGTSRAREILDERYARGELDTDEYHERLRELS